MVGQPVEQPADTAEAEERGGVQVRQDPAQDLHGQPAGRLNTFGSNWSLTTLVS